MVHLTQLFCESSLSFLLLHEGFESSLWPGSSDGISNTPICIPPEVCQLPALARQGCFWIDSDEPVSCHSSCGSNNCSSVVVHLCRSFVPRVEVVHQTSRGDQVSHCYEVVHNLIALAHYVGLPLQPLRDDREGSFKLCVGASPPDVVDGCSEEAVGHHQIVEAPQALFCHLLRAVCPHDGAEDVEGRSKLICPRD